MKYLAFGNQADKVKSGCVRVRLAETLKTRHKYYDSVYELVPADEPAFAEQKTLPAGSALTVIGVFSGFDINADDGDLFLCLTEDGQAVQIWNAKGVLIPGDESLGSARAVSDVRMRVSVGKNAEIIRTLSRGAKVEVLLRGEGWTMVRHRDRVGYVLTRYLGIP